MRYPIFIAMCLWAMPSFAQYYSDGDGGQAEMLAGQMQQTYAMQQWQQEQVQRQQQQQLDRQQQEINRFNGASPIERMTGNY